MITICVNCTGDVIGEATVRNGKVWEQHGARHYFFRCWRCRHTWVSWVPLHLADAEPADHEVN